MTSTIGSPIPIIENISGIIFGDFSEREIRLLLEWEVLVVEKDEFKMSSVM